MAEPKIDPKIIMDISHLIQANLDITDTLISIFAIIKERIIDYNFVGFYIFKEESQKLTLGPFIGLEPLQKEGTEYLQQTVLIKNQIIFKEAPHLLTFKIELKNTLLGLLQIEAIKGIILDEEDEEFFKKIVDLIKPLLKEYSSALPLY